MGIKEYYEDDIDETINNVMYNSKEIDEKIKELEKRISEYKEAKIFVENKLKELKSLETKNVIFIRKSSDAFDGVEYIIETCSIDIINERRVENIDFNRLPYSKKSSMFDILKELSIKYNTKDIITEEKLIKKIHEEFNIISTN